jgi:hypothetical protein
MALGKEELDEKGKNEVGAKPAINEVVERSTEENDAIAIMQKQIAALQSQLQHQLQNPGTKSNSDELMKQFIQKMGGSEQITEGGQFKFQDVYVGDTIDEDDVLPQDEWVTFVTHKVMHIIVDDKRNGKNVRAPFDIIAFRYESTKKVVHGRETDLIHLSTYTCKSRTELKWLREHSRFGISFFDNIKTALSTDVERATKLAKQMIILSRIGQASIIGMCKERGLPITSDLDSMRAALAYHSVETEMARVKNSFEASAKEQDAEAIIIGKSLVN